MILAALAMAAAAALIALCRPRSGRRLARAAETFVLTLTGGLAARGFIAIVLAIGGQDEASVTVTGLLFFIWPGVFNLAGLALGAPPITAEGLLWIALVVGAFTGFHDGLWATHDWRRRGAVGFALDITWGLAGSTNAAVLHLVNLGWGDHADDEARRGVHRYRRGFAPGPGFAFAQGAVMSNTGAHGPPSALFRHERIHVWQSRLAGPFFWFSYLGWMAMLLPFSLAAAAVHRERRVGEIVQWWTYFNNPWEVMAYAIANPGVRADRRSPDGGPTPSWLCWPWRMAALAGGLGGAVLLAAWLALVAVGIWGGQAA